MLPIAQPGDDLPNGRSELQADNGSNTGQREHPPFMLMIAVGRGVPQPASPPDLPHTRAAQRKKHQKNENDQNFSAHQPVDSDSSYHSASSQGSGWGDVRVVGSLLLLIWPSHPTCGWPQS
jgi:hypothetical protein